MKIPGVAVGEVAGKGEVEIVVMIEHAPGIFPILGVAVEHAAPGGEFRFEDFPDIMSGFSIVDDYRKSEAFRQLELGDEKFNLGAFITELPEVVQSGFADGDDTVFLCSVVDFLLPIQAGMLNFRRRDADTEYNVGGRREILINTEEISKVVGDAHNSLNIGLFGFLDDDQLLYRVFIDETDMGVSVEVPHE